MATNSCGNAGGDGGGEHWQIQVATAMLVATTAAIAYLSLASPSGDESLRRCRWCLRGDYWLVKETTGNCGDIGGPAAAIDCLVQVATNSCGDAGGDCGGDRLVTGSSKERRIAVRVAMQVMTAAVITDWSKWDA